MWIFKILWSVIFNFCNEMFTCLDYFFLILSNIKILSIYFLSVNFVFNNF